MRWAQVSVVTTHEGADLIGNILMELGAAGTEIDDPSLVNEYIDAGLWDYTDLPRAEDTDTVTVRAYLPEDERLEGSLLTLTARVEGLRRADARIGAGTISHTFVADEDWAETWKAYIHTEKIGQRIVVRPTWEEYTPAEDEIVIDLDPGAAFGTGAHATTAMCLRWLERLVSPQMWAAGRGFSRLPRPNSGRVKSSRWTMIPSRSRWRMKISGRTTSEMSLPSRATCLLYVREQSLPN